MNRLTARVSCFVPADALAVAPKAPFIFLTSTLRLVIAALSCVVVTVAELGGLHTRLSDFIPARRTPRYRGFCINNAHSWRS